MRTRTHTRTHMHTHTHTHTYCSMFLLFAGQFWNVAIDVDEFTGDLRDGEATDNVYIVTVRPQGTAQRQFPAWLEAKVSCKAL